MDFSGGQRQKLVLARALYRQAGTLILDEPTAALDALAENDIYEKYAEMFELHIGGIFSGAFYR